MGSGKIGQNVAVSEAVWQARPPMIDGMPYHAGGPFFNLANAANYCGYAIGTFERIVREYDIPRYGPKRNRYARSVLDAWMHSPEAFKKNSSPKPRRRTPQPVTV